jgi:hypothetical protein
VVVVVVNAWVENAENTLPSFHFRLFLNYAHSYLTWTLDYLGRYLFTSIWIS